MQAQLNLVAAILGWNRVFEKISPRRCRRTAYECPLSKKMKWDIASGKTTERRLRELSFRVP
jgi:hypothetical protein